MGSAIVLALLAGVGFTALFLPWVGVAGAYLIGILNPQSIWWWSFEGLRPVYWALLPTLIGVVLMGVRGKLRWEALANVRIVCLLVMWLTGMLSWWLAPYSLSVAENGQFDIRGAGFIMDNLSKIILLFIIAVLVTNTTNQLKAMSFVMLASGLYLTWWVNDRYFFNGAFGRVAGPTPLTGDGTYTDENAFGSLFVATFPFVWYAGFSAKRLWLRVALFLSVLLIWHGVFLTGSRGALLALGASMLVIVLRMKRRTLGLALITIFAVTFVWQAGDTMMNRAASIDEYSEDASATGRLDAWEAGGRMMLSYPLTGVGPGAYLRAFSDFSDKQIRQAHNTLIQFGAEFGPTALVAVAVLLGSCIFSLWKIEPIWSFDKTGNEDPELFVREAVLAAVVGVTVTGFFLSQQLFELMYYLVFMSTVLLANHRTRVIESKLYSAPEGKGGNPAAGYGLVPISARRKQVDRLNI